MNKATVEQAFRRAQPHLRRTPLKRSQQLSNLIQADVYLKLENEQVSGSFKARGALQVMASLTEEQKSLGVIAPTAGNHGMGLAYAGRAAGVPVHVYLPQGADTSKVNYMLEQGASISYYPDIEAARQAALRAAGEEGLYFVSAYNNPHMIAGAGGVGLEVLEELPDLDLAIVCTRGGGLTAGMGLYLKAKNPGIRLVAVQPENSPTFAEWFRHGRTAEVFLRPSIAEGLSGFIDPATITFPVFMEVVDEVITVTETEMMVAMHWLQKEQNLVAEPSGVAAVAALLAGKVQAPGKKIAATVTGGNVSPERFNLLLKGLLKA
ncbi:L-threonine ammonia-lyase [Pontibacter ummariensis]|uniref:L-threonine ammonia-lyase n=1 Tax=Pontibacter ummariensis TaxID=1610492 RepID=A0A239LIB1_9BACT|nr:pyridoxal-phosphate dependent enzyme [Pontibacter ummariensis]PRY03133.1 L-threonine ammonia-lyase [Pontibacter ummariensis]SNT30326.1 L-threonine ammonia-lyase [Pontibacter ummariensis]